MESCDISGYLQKLSKYRMLLVQATYAAFTLTFDKEFNCGKENEDQENKSPKIVAAAYNKNDAYKIEDFEMFLKTNHLINRIKSLGKMNEINNGNLRQRNRQIKKILAYAEIITLTRVALENSAVELFDGNENILDENYLTELTKPKVSFFTLFEPLLLKHTQKLSKFMSDYFYNSKSTSKYSHQLNRNTLMAKSNELVKKVIKINVSFCTGNEQITVNTRLSNLKNKILESEKSHMNSTTTNIVSLVPHLICENNFSQNAITGKDSACSILQRTRYKSFVSESSSDVCKTKSSSRKNKLAIKFEPINPFKRRLKIYERVNDEPQSKMCITADFSCQDIDFPTAFDNFCYPRPVGSSHETDYDWLMRNEARGRKHNKENNFPKDCYTVQITTTPENGQLCNNISNPKSKTTPTANAPKCTRSEAKHSNRPEHRSSLKQNGVSNDHSTSEPNEKNKMKHKLKSERYLNSQQESKRANGITDQNDTKKQIVSKNQSADSHGRKCQKMKQGILQYTDGDGIEKSLTVNNMEFKINDKNKYVAKQTTTSENDWYSRQETDCNYDKKCWSSVDHEGLLKLDDVFYKTTIGDKSNTDASKENVELKHKSSIRQKINARGDSDEATKSHSDQQSVFKEQTSVNKDNHFFQETSRFKEINNSKNKIDSKKLLCTKRHKSESNGKTVQLNENFDYECRLNGHSDHSSINKSDKNKTSHKVNVLFPMSNVDVSKNAYNDMTKTIQNTKIYELKHQLEEVSNLSLQKDHKKHKQKSKRDRSTSSEVLCHSEDQNKITKCTKKNKCTHPRKEKVRRSKQSDVGKKQSSCTQTNPIVIERQSKMTNVTPSIDFSEDKSDAMNEKSPSSQASSSQKDYHHANQHHATQKKAKSKHRSKSEELDKTNYIKEFTLDITPQISKSTQQNCEEQNMLFINKHKSHHQSHSTQTGNREFENDSKDLHNNDGINDVKNKENISNQKCKSVHRSIPEKNVYIKKTLQDQQQKDNKYCRIETADQITNEKEKKSNELRDVESYTNLDKSKRFHKVDVYEYAETSQLQSECHTQSCSTQTTNVQFEDNLDVTNDVYKKDGIRHKNSHNKRISSRSKSQDQSISELKNDIKHSHSDRNVKISKTVTDTPQQRSKNENVRFFKQKSDCEQQINFTRTTMNDFESLVNLMDAVEQDTKHITADTKGLSNKFEINGHANNKKDYMVMGNNKQQKKNSNGKSFLCLGDEVKLTNKVKKHSESKKTICKLKQIHNSEERMHLNTKSIYKQVSCATPSIPIHHERQWELMNDNDEKNKCEQQNGIITHTHSNQRRNYKDCNKVNDQTNVKIETEARTCVTSKSEFKNRSAHKVVSILSCAWDHTILNQQPTNLKNKTKKNKGKSRKPIKYTTQSSQTEIQNSIQGLEKLKKQLEQFYNYVQMTKEKHFRCCHSQPLDCLDLHQNGNECITNRMLDQNVFKTLDTDKTLANRNSLSACFCSSCVANRETQFTSFNNQYENSFNLGPKTPMMNDTKRIIAEPQKNMRCDVSTLTQHFENLGNFTDVDSPYCQRGDGNSRNQHFLWETLPQQTYNFRNSNINTHQRFPRNFRKFDKGPLTTETLLYFLNNQSANNTLQNFYDDHNERLAKIFQYVTERDWKTGQNPTLEEFETLKYIATGDESMDKNVNKYYAKKKMQFSNYVKDLKHKYIAAKERCKKIQPKITAIVLQYAQESALLAKFQYVTHIPDCGPTRENNVVITFVKKSIMKEVICFYNEALKAKQKMNSNNIKVFYDCSTQMKTEFCSSEAKMEKYPIINNQNEKTNKKFLERKHVSYPFPKYYLSHRQRRKYKSLKWVKRHGANRMYKNNLEKIDDTQSQRTSDVSPVNDNKGKMSEDDADAHPNVSSDIGLPSNVLTTVIHYSRKHDESKDHQHDDPKLFSHTDSSPTVQYALTNCRRNSNQKSAARVYFSDQVIQSEEAKLPTGAKKTQILFPLKTITISTQTDVNDVFFGENQHLLFACTQKKIYKKGRKPTSSWKRFAKIIDIVKRAVNEKLGCKKHSEHGSGKVKNDLGLNKNTYSSMKLSKINLNMNIKTENESEIIRNNLKALNLHNGNVKEGKKVKKLFNNLATAPLVTANTIFKSSKSARFYLFGDTTNSKHKDNVIKSTEFKIKNHRLSQKTDILNNQFYADTNFGELEQMANLSHSYWNIKPYNSFLPEQTVHSANVNRLQTCQYKNHKTYSSPTPTHVRNKRNKCDCRLCAITHYEYKSKLTDDKPKCFKIPKTGKFSRDSQRNDRHENVNIPLPPQNISLNGGYFNTSGRTELKGKDYNSPCYRNQLFAPEKNEQFCGYNAGDSQKTAGYMYNYNKLYSPHNMPLVGSSNVYEHPITRYENSLLLYGPRRQTQEINSISLHLKQLLNNPEKYLNSASYSKNHHNAPFSPPNLISQNTNAAFLSTSSSIISEIASQNFNQNASNESVAQQENTNRNMYRSCPIMSMTKANDKTPTAYKQDNVAGATMYYNCTLPNNSYLNKPCYTPNVMRDFNKPKHVEISNKVVAIGSGGNVTTCPTGCLCNKVTVSQRPDPFVGVVSNQHYPNHLVRHVDSMTIASSHQSNKCYPSVCPTRVQNAAATSVMCKTDTCNPSPCIRTCKQPPCAVIKSSSFVRNVSIPPCGGVNSTTVASHTCLSLSCTDFDRDVRTLNARRQQLMGEIEKYNRDRELLVVAANRRARKASVSDMVKYYETGGGGSQVTTAVTSFHNVTHNEAVKNANNATTTTIYKQGPVSGTHQKIVMPGAVQTPFVSACHGYKPIVSCIKNPTSNCAAYQSFSATRVNTPCCVQTSKSMTGAVTQTMPCRPAVCVDNHKYDTDTLFEINRMQQQLPHLLPQNQPRYNDDCLVGTHAKYNLCCAGSSKSPPVVSVVSNAHLYSNVRNQCCCQYCQAFTSCNNSAEGADHLVAKASSSLLSSEVCDMPIDNKNHDSSTCPQAIDQCQNNVTANGINNKKYIPDAYSEYWPEVSSTLSFKSKSNHKSEEEIETMIKYPTNKTEIQSFLQKVNSLLQPITIDE